MKAEIKEILEFKKDADYKRLSVDEIVILKDYIINLQEKYEKQHTQNARMKKEIGILCNRLDARNKQIDKVVEFTNEYIREDYYEQLDEYITHFTWNKEKEDLLNILNGGDKE